MGLGSVDRFPSRVFISFVHEDEQVAFAVRHLIERELKIEEGVFLSSDQHTIYAGDNWIETIIHALKSAQVVVSMFSKRSVGRPWVNFEAGAAMIREKTVLIPCCYGRQTRETLPHPYSALQAVDLNVIFNDHYLLESIHHHLGLTTPGPEPPIARHARIQREEREQRDKGAAIPNRRSMDAYDYLFQALSNFNDEGHENPFGMPPARA
jgi:TIR domain-containing protein